MSADLRAMWIALEHTWPIFLFLAVAFTLAVAACWAHRDCQTCSNRRRSSVAEARARYSAEALELAEAGGLPPCGAVYVHDPALVCDRPQGHPRDYHADSRTGRGDLPVLWRTAS